MEFVCVPSIWIKYLTDVDMCSDKPMIYDSSQ